MLNLETRPFSDLMSTVQDQVYMYADSGLIDDTTLIPVVARCNEVLGVRLNPYKQAILQVENGMATIPSDFYKVESAMAVRTCEEINFGFPTSRDEQQTMNPEKKTVFAHLNIENLWIPAKDGDTENIGMLNPCTNEFWEGRVNKTVPNLRRIVDVYPLQLTDRSRSFCTNYCPNFYWKAKYTIDFQEGVIKAPFEKGEILLCYLGQLQDPTTGELLIPFHPRIWPYYEYSVLAKVFEIIFLNSDADVSQKLGYVQQKIGPAYSDAIDVVMSAKGKQWIKYNKEREAHFHNKWMKAFYC